MNGFRIAVNVPDPNAVNPYLKDFDSSWGFNSEKEMVDAMSDPRYSSLSQDGMHYREAVGKMLAQSDFGNNLTSNEAKASARKARYLRDEDHQIAREATLALFNTDLYRTSAAERRRVRELIAANQEHIEQALPETRNGPSVKKSRLQFTEADMLEIKKAVEAEKQAAIEKRRQDAIENATREAEQKYVDITGMVAGRGNDDGE